MSQRAGRNSLPVVRVRSLPGRSACSRVTRPWFVRVILNSGAPMA